MAYTIDIDGAEFHVRRVADSKVDGREVFATFGQARAADAVDWPPPGKPWSRERFDATGPVA